MFLGTTFLGGNYAISPTVTYINDCKTISMSNMICDEAYISKDTSYIITDPIPTVWDYNTDFHATFNNTLDAGNVAFNTSNTSHILIKRRKKYDFAWTTIYVKEINSVDDFNVIGVDYTNGGNAVYEYAVVPTLNGVEGNYNITEVTSTLDGIYIVTANAIYGTRLNPGGCDTNRQILSSITPLPNSKFPKYLKNSLSNYDIGTASGIFIEINEDSCDLDAENGYTYRKNIVDELSSGNLVLLKHHDGRMWLTGITGNINDAMESATELRTISFEWAEVGSATSTKDLAKAGLINVSSEWW